MKLKPETKMKWRMRWNKAKAYAPWFGIGATVGAAWFGWFESIKLNGKINMLENRQDGIIDTLNGNVSIANNNYRIFDDRISELEQNNVKLFNLALKETEGEDKGEEPEK